MAESRSPPINARSISMRGITRDHRHLGNREANSDKVLGSIIGGFGTFAVYLPELFPTRVRATGQGFCWNAARCVTAIGPLIACWLVAEFGSFPAAAGAVAFAYVVGPVMIWFGPETRGVPLAD